jgi:hypothetical protein
MHTLAAGAAAVLFHFDAPPLTAGSHSAFGCIYFETQKAGDVHSMTPPAAPINKAR